MFNLLPRNLTFSVSQTTLIYRLFLRSLSSSPTASDSNPVKFSSINNSFTISYLIDSCGLPPEKAISASKYLYLKTPNRANSVIALFRNQGFTETQISHMVSKFPMALTFNPKTNLLPKFAFLSSVGLTDSDIVKLLTANPTALGRSLKNHLEPNFNLLRDMLQSNDKTLTAIRRCAWVLDWDLQSHVVPNMQLLRDVGVPGSKMMYLLTNQPRDFLTSSQLFKKALDEVVVMGFDPLKISFLLAVHALRSMSKSTWERKMEAYQKWGWSKDEILVAFRCDPWCMVKSEEKINKVMDFIVNEMGFETSIIKKNPGLLTLSMEKRIIPRCLVYKHCLDNTLFKNKNIGFNRWIKCSEDTFIKRLERYEEEVPGVLKFYREKLNHKN